jgi:thiamine biosynthesis lipoprotein
MPALARALHVEFCMGTAFTVDIRDPGRWDAAIAEAVTWLHHVDRVFSTYQPDSDVSRMRRGELRLAAADPDVADVLALCADVQAETNGYFGAIRDGQVDPTGLVKGWAVERLGGLLRRRGARNFAINGGGDIQAAGEATPGRSWVVGITDPADRQRVLTIVSGRDFAVATSGVAERGSHITEPFTGQPATALTTVTIVGPSLTRADAYATAAFAMGQDALRWIDSVPDYHALIVTTGGVIRTSADWLAALPVDQASCSARSPAHSVWNEPSSSTRL